MRPSFGTVSYMIFANNNAFKKLSPADQKMLLDVGYKLEKDTVVLFARLLTEEDAEAAKRGAKIAEYPQLKKADLDKLFAEEIWKIAYRGANGKEGERIHQLAKSKGVTY
jgi:TRAP-type C4-dicarboxylate transport system substrate-binding protein